MWHATLDGHCHAIHSTWIYRKARFARSGFWEGQSEIRPLGVLIPKYCIIFSKFVMLTSIHFCCTIPYLC